MSEATVPDPSVVGQVDSSEAVEEGPQPLETRASRKVRLIEIIPGLITWILILAPIPLSLRYPEIVGWFVLSFDFYWLYRAVVLSVSVSISFRRIRRVMAIDWRRRSLVVQGR